MNSVTVLGNLTRDPELDTSGHTRICRMRLAESYGPKGTPLYINVAAFGPQAERCARFLHKGREILISGRLRFSEWEGDDGVKRSAISIVAERIQFLSGGRDSERETVAAPD